MDTFSPVLIGAAVAAVVAFGVRRLLRARARSAPDRRDAAEATRLGADITFIVIGALLMALSVAVGMHLLEIKDPPRGELFPAGAGIATDARPRVDRGFVAGMAVGFRSCDRPVDVTLVFAGTAEYFEDNRAVLTTETGFTLALPGTDDVTDVSVAYGHGFSDALAPHTAEGTNEEMLDAPDDTEAGSTPRGDGGPRKRSTPGHPTSRRSSLASRRTGSSTVDWGRAI